MLTETRVFNSLEGLCITRMTTIDSFMRAFISQQAANRLYSIESFVVLQLICVARCAKSLKSTRVYTHTHTYIYIYIYIYIYGVMVIVVGNGHGDTSSNPGRD